MPGGKSSKKIGTKERKDGAGGGGGKKKGKGKVKKTKKLSEDAKTRQQEQRAAIEEERRRMREELVATFLRHKLLKEQYLTRLNQSKIIEKWRHVLREAKSVQLCRELTTMKLDFDKRFARNNNEIHRLTESLLQSGVDFAKLCDDNGKHMTNTFGEHEKHLKALDDLYQEERDSLESSLTCDYDSANGRHRQTHATLLETVQRLQLHYQNSYQSQRNHFQIRKDEIINQGLEEEHTVRLLLERRLETKWQQLHENCVENGELDQQRWSLYLQLRAKDLAAAEQQRSAANQIDQLQASMAKLQLIKKQSVHDETMYETLERHRMELHDRRERWRIKLLKQQDRHCLRLKALASASSETAEHLEQLARHCLMILRCAQRCSLLKPLQSGGGSSSVMVNYLPPATEPFQHFWTRFNSAYLETVLLQRHQTAVRVAAAGHHPLASIHKGHHHQEQWIVSGKALLIPSSPAANDEDDECSKSDDDFIVLSDD